MKKLVKKTTAVKKYQGGGIKTDTSTTKKMSEKDAIKAIKDYKKMIGEKVTKSDTTQTKMTTPKLDARNFMKKGGAVKSKKK